MRLFSCVSADLFVSMCLCLYVSLFFCRCFMDSLSLLFSFSLSKIRGKRIFRIFLYNFWQQLFKSSTSKDFRGILDKYLCRKRADWPRASRPSSPYPERWGILGVQYVVLNIRDEDPDPVLFSTDPNPDPTCNNGVMKLFSSWTKYKPESTNSSKKWWFIISNFMPTYLKYI